MEQVAPARATPAERPWQGPRFALRRGVEPDPGDLHERVTVVRVDGDPPPETVPAPAEEVDRVERRPEKAGGVQHIRDRTRAVVAGVREAAVSAAPDVGLATDAVPRPDRALDLNRSPRWRVRDTVDDLR